jgi:hypothetical protein
VIKESQKKLRGCRRHSTMGIWNTMAMGAMDTRGQSSVKNHAADI